MTLSYRNEEKIRAAFAALVDATPAGADFEDLTDIVPKPVHIGRPGLVVMAVAAIVTLVVLGPLALPMGRSGTPSSTSDEVPPPAGIPDSAPLPGTVVPYLESPPAWFGEPVAAERLAADRTGRWVSTLLGVETGDGQVSFPVSVALTDGTLRGLDAAEEVIVGGRALRSLSIGDWQAIATTEGPTIIVSGAVDTSLLLEVLDAVTTGATATGDSLTVSPVPTGYVERVAPQLHAQDFPSRRMLTNADGDTSINEISDWVDPELAAAGSGAEYRLVDIDGAEGWTGRTESNPFGALTFLVWSPEPGVVLEIVTTNSERTTEELIELASATSLISASEWDDAFGLSNTQ
jgi:hypothetical protein